MQLFDVSTSNQYHFGLYSRTFLIQGDVIFNKYFFTTPLRKDPKDAVMIRGWGMLFGLFSFIKCSQTTIIESGEMESLKSNNDGDGN